MSSSYILNPTELEQSQNLQEFEELLVKHFMRLSPRKTILEIGSLFGWSLKHWIYYSEPKSIVISIDLPVAQFCGPHDPRCEQQEKMQKEIWPQWARERQSSLYLFKTRSQSPAVWKKITQILHKHQKNWIDFLFIDGDHNFDAIMTDFLIYGSLVRRGGIIAFHDIGPNEEGGGHQFWHTLLSLYPNQQLHTIRYDSQQQKGIGVFYV